MCVCDGATAPVHLPVGAWWRSAVVGLSLAQGQGQTEQSLETARRRDLELENRCSNPFVKVVSESGHEASFHVADFVRVGEGTGKNRFLEIILIFSQLLFQSRQRWHVEGGKMRYNLSSRPKVTFPGHRRYFHLGAKIFSFEIIKQHHHLLGDFVLSVI